jgi:hypothetical protein
MAVCAQDVEANRHRLQGICAINFVRLIAKNRLRATIFDAICNGRQDRDFERSFDAVLNRKKRELSLECPSNTCGAD